MQNTTAEYKYAKKQYLNREYLHEIYNIGYDIHSKTGSDIMQGWKREFICQIIKKGEHNLDGSGNNALHMIILSLSSLTKKERGMIYGMFKLFLPFLYISPELLHQKNAAGATVLSTLLVEGEKLRTSERIKILKLLVRSGANLYTAKQYPKAKAGYQKLIEESQLNELGKEKIIKETGLNFIENPYFDEQNPLTIAVKERNLKHTNILLRVHSQYSAKRMMQSRYNYIQSALQHAWDSRDMAVVEMLLNFYVGSGNNFYNSFFDEQFQPSFLIRAIEYQNHSIVKFILENCLSDVRIKDQNGYDALFYAVTRESFEIAKTLLKTEVNRTRLYAQYKIGLNEDDIGTSTLAHWAAYNNKAKILHEIWNTQHTTFNVKDYMDRLPLHIAILHSDIDVVLNIIKKSSDHNWNRQDASGQTFLHNALERGNLSIIKKLTTVGADITIKDSNGFTPLMIAARDSSNEIFEVLAKHPKVKKALDDVNELDYNRSVAHYIAMSGSAFKRFTAFPDGLGVIPQEYCIDSLGNTLIHYAALSDDTMLIVSLMGCSTKSGIFINHQNYEGQTAFHLAAGAKINPKIFKSFLSNGAIMIGDDYNNMLLHYAARYSRAENIMPLISLGADLNARNQYGNQPIHIAAGYANAAVIKILVDAGADIESVNKSGQTPLDIAVKYKNSVTLKALIEAGANIPHMKNKDHAVMQMFNNAVLAVDDCVARAQRYKLHEEIITNKIFD